MPRDMDRYREYQKEYRAARKAERDDMKLMSFEEIGRRLGISGVYAGRIYAQAIAKLKAEIEAHGL